MPVLPGCCAKQAVVGRVLEPFDPFECDVHDQTGEIPGEHHVAATAEEKDRVAVGIGKGQGLPQIIHAFGAAKIPAAGGQPEGVQLL